MGVQEKEAHAATEAQFRSLYRDKYAPLKEWLAGAEGEARPRPHLSHTNTQAILD